MSVRIINADVLEGLRQLPDESVHCVVTSPPYWGLRDYGVVGQLGLEPTPVEFVASMVAVFREVRRVLRKDGTCWMNLGDSYLNAKGQAGGVDPKQPARRHGLRPQDVAIEGIKRKDLVGIPWRVAFALQDDGWYLRSDIIWSKANAMPESVTDRPTKAHEYIFLLTKSERYFYDHESIKEEAVSEHPSGNGFTRSERLTYRNPDGTARGNDKPWVDVGGMRNKRSVWEINTVPYPGAHFAVFPPELPELCIKAGTSQHGCCAACGAPWKRRTEKSSINCSNAAIAGKGHTSSQVRDNHDIRNGPVTVTKTIGWEPTCVCNSGVMPCTVLDPFFGSGTTGLVADRLQRNAIGIELNPTYAAMAQDRINGDRGGLLDLMDGAA